MARSESKRPNQADARWAGATFLSLALAHTLLVILESSTRESWPDGSGDIETYKQALYWLSAVIASGVFAAFALRRFRFWRVRGVRLALRIALCVALLGSGLFYFFGVRGYAKSGPYVHTHDSYHYLLGPKYYKEIGYFDLYECTIEAKPDLFRGNTKVTDLHRNKRVKLKKLPDRKGPSCREVMGEERWKEFRHDLDVFVDLKGRRALQTPIHDLGYNGTPALSTLGYTVSNTVPLNYRTLHYFTLLDVYLICAMMYVVFASFGWEIGTLFALFFFINPADRYSVVGGSFLRYSWFAALVFGLAALKRERYMAAGAWLATATMLTVHPAVFIIGVITQGCATWLRDKKFPRYLGRFVLAGAITGALIGGLSTVPRGPQAYSEFAEDMRVHDPTSRLPGFGTGYKWVFLYRGEHKKGMGVSKNKKRKQFAQVDPVYRATGLAIIGLAIIVTLTASATESAMLVGFAIMFCRLETTGYYFLSAAFLILVWYRKLHNTGPPLIIGSFFALTAFSWYVFASGYKKYLIYNTLSSGIWLIILLLSIGYFAMHDSTLRRLLRLAFPPPPDSEPPTGETPSEPVAAPASRTHTGSRTE